MGGRRTARLWGVAVAAVMPLLIIPADARAIIGGDYDGDSHPNVGLIVALDAQGRLADACTGTLVAPTVVVTAAHCVAGSALGVVDRYVVTFQPAPNLAHGFGDFIGGAPHFDPRFQTGPLAGGSAAFYDNSRYDVGVLVLDRPASDLSPGINPAPLPAEGTLDRYRTGTRNRYFTSVGYGVQRSGPPGQPDSFFIDFIRRTTTSPLMKLTDTLLYTQGVSNDARGGGGICSGDSGGPVFSGAAVVAIGTFVNGPCQNGDGGPRLDTETTRSFLNQFLPLP